MQKRIPQNTICTIKFGNLQGANFRNTTSFYLRPVHGGGDKHGPFKSGPKGDQVVVVADIRHANNFKHRDVVVKHNGTEYYIHASSLSIQPS